MQKCDGRTKNSNQDCEKLSKQEKRAKAIANLKMEFCKIIKGIFEFKKAFLFYFIVLLISVIIFGISQFYSNLENILSASRATQWGIITSIFVHSNLAHLAFNMGSLFAFIFFFAFCNSTFSLQIKRRIENFFLVSVFVFAVTSNILWIALASKGTIGASGLVYAVEGDLIGFSLVNSLQLHSLSKFKVLNITTRLVVFMNIVVCFAVIAEVFLNTDIFLGVGQGVNIISHGLSFLLGLFISFIWCYAIAKVSILNRMA